MLHRVILAASTLVITASTTLLAQQATIVGRAVDESQAVLPGVTVTATAADTGRQFVSVTSDRGEYHLTGLPPGRYRLEAELVGFAPAVLPDLELLVGQSAEITLRLGVASLKETITVTGESPLVDTRQTHVASNVDRRQMEELPISGRNWMELSLQVKGITANAISTTPGVTGTLAFRLNLDGQEVTQDRVGAFGQGGISRDAIAEYQVITNMFDVTMGRSIGIQVQAVSRAGTNDLAGSLYGYFRDDAFNARDHFVKSVLPYSNRQIGGTFGGPLVRDRVHYFLSFEYEREPGTFVSAPAVFAPQTRELPMLRTERYGLGRVDYQLNEKNHLTLRTNLWDWEIPTLYGTGSGFSANAHPAAPQIIVRDSQMISGNWSRILHNNMLSEIKVSYYKYHYGNYLHEPKTIQYSFPGFTLGSRGASPSDGYQRSFTTRADLTWNKGAHDLKFGAELPLRKDGGYWRRNERGVMTFSQLPADVARRFPLDAHPSQWDFSGLDSTVTRFEINYAVGDNWTVDIPHPTIAAWINDTWAVHDRLKLNLGVRYDVAWNDFIAPGVKETDLLIDNGLFVENVGYRNDIRDLANVAPRVGFNWDVTGRTGLIIRGGIGLFYSAIWGQHRVANQLFNGQRVIVSTYENDRRPGFIADPTRGVTPEDVLSGRAAVPPQAIEVIAHDYRRPRMWQGMIGFQKQLNQVTGFDADLIYNKGSRLDAPRDPNLFYDPATGLFKNPLRFGRPRPDFGPVNLKEAKGYSDYLALASSLTRRYRNNFQLGFTHTVMFFKRDTGGGLQLNPFDLSMDWGRASDFQRHTVNANGIWRLPAAFQLAGTYHYGSGNYSQVIAPTLPLGTGPRRVRADLSIIPKNTFKEDAWQALSLRVSKDVRLFGDVKVTGMAEVFNVFNYARYDRNQIEGHALFGQAVRAGQAPRTGQLAFRVSW